MSEKVPQRNQNKCKNPFHKHHPHKHVGAEEQMSIRGQNMKYRLNNPKQIKQSVTYQVWNMSTFHKTLLCLSGLIQYETFHSVTCHQSFRLCETELGLHCTTETSVDLWSIRVHIFFPVFGENHAGKYNNSRLNVLILNEGLPSLYKVNVRER